jgi:sigma-B regulation protein RsbU (phosphoserine phosphatase)
MSVRRLVATVLTLVTVLFAAAAVVVAIQAVAVHRAQQRLQTVLDPAALLSRQLLSDYVNQETGERGYIIAGNPTFLVPYTDGTAAAASDTAKLAALLRGSPSLGNDVNATRTAGAAWAAAIAPELAARRAGDPATADELVAAGAGKAAFDELRTKIEQLQGGIDTERSHAQRSQNNATTLLAITLIVAAIVALAAVVLFSVAARRGITRPITRLAALMRQVRAGAIHTVITGTGPTEIRALANHAETMRARLVHQIDTAQHATEGLIQQAPVVVEIRHALQPAPGPADRPDGLQIAGQMIPAEGEIAGDWWDTITDPDGRVTIVVVDVSGHGPAAALLAVELKAVIRAGLRTGHDPGALLDGPARDVFAGQPAMFATAVIIEFDPAARRLHWINAGHPPPLLLSASGQLYPLDPTGPLINPLTAGTARASLPFEPGDVLLAYTDGLIESTGAEDVTVTEAALVQTLRGTTTAAGAVDQVLALLERLTGRHRHRDDITVVSAYQGAPNENRNLSVSDSDLAEIC